MNLGVCTSSKNPIALQHYLDLPAAMFAENTLATLMEGQIDFTVFFDRLTRVAVGEADEILLGLFTNQSTGVAWIDWWRQLGAEGAAAPSCRRGKSSTSCCNSNLTVTRQTRGIVMYQLLKKRFRGC